MSCCACQGASLCPLIRFGKQRIVSPRFWQSKSSRQICKARQLSSWVWRKQLSRRWLTLLEGWVTISRGLARLIQTPTRRAFTMIPQTWKAAGAMRLGFKSSTSFSHSESLERVPTSVFGWTLHLSLVSLLLGWVYGVTKILNEVHGVSLPLSLNGAHAGMICDPRSWTSLSGKRPAPACRPCESLLKGRLGGPLRALFCLSGIWPLGGRRIREHVIFFSRTRP